MSIRKIAKSSAKLTSGSVVAVVGSWCGFVHYNRWRDEHQHLAEELTVAPTEELLNTAYRCNLLGHDYLNQEQIRDWHRSKGFYGGIVLRNFKNNEKLSFLDQFYDELCGETEQWRKECYYVYYEVDGDGKRRQDVYLRGTAALSDYVVDFCWGKELDEETGQFFHRGFLHKANVVLADLEPLLDLNADTYVSGHSLGGAVGSIVAWKLKQRGFNIQEVLTFGSPKWGVHCAPPFEYTNVGHEDDPICNLPPDGLSAVYKGTYTFAGNQLRIRKEDDGGFSLRKLSQETPIWRQSMANAPIPTGGIEPHRMRTYEGAIRSILDKNNNIFSKPSIVPRTQESRINNGQNGAVLPGMTIVPDPPATPLPHRTESPPAPGATTCAAIPSYDTVSMKNDAIKDYHQSKDCVEASSNGYSLNMITVDGVSQVFNDVSERVWRNIPINLR